MKKIIFCLSLLLSAPITHAMEIVNCTDTSGIWKVNFTLDEKIVSNLQFIYFNQMVASAPTTRAIVNHIGSRTYYDVNFNYMYYFDFEREDGSKQLTGAFYIPQDPNGMENYVTCDAF